MCRYWYPYHVFTFFEPILLIRYTFNIQRYGSNYKYKYSVLSYRYGEKKVAFLHRKKKTQQFTSSISLDWEKRNTHQPPDLLLERYYSTTLNKWSDCKMHAREFVIQIWNKKPHSNRTWNFKFITIRIVMKRRESTPRDYTFKLKRIVVRLNAFSVRFFLCLFIWPS